MKYFQQDRDSILSFVEENHVTPRQLSQLLRNNPVANRISSQLATILKRPLFNNPSRYPSPIGWQTKDGLWVDGICLNKHRHWCADPKLCRLLLAPSREELETIYRGTTIKCQELLITEMEILVNSLFPLNSATGEVHVLGAAYTIRLLDFIKDKSETLPFTTHPHKFIRQLGKQALKKF